MIGIYGRKSSEEQSQYSMNDQIRKCRQKAKSEHVKEYIDDGYSGEFLDRPAMIQLRADVKAGLITKVICLDPDRLARKLVAQLIISEEIEKRAELVFVNGEYARTPEGMLFYQMRGAVAEFEKAKINERMSNGRRQKARQGKVVKDYQVYGYGYDKEAGQMYIIEEEAQVIRMIYEFLISPMQTLTGKAKGINSIAQYLTTEKYPTKKGGNVWHRQVVRQILMNRAYIGEFYQNRWNTEGMLGNKHRPTEDKVKMKERPKEEWIYIPCPPIITEIQFEHAQRLLQEGKRRWAKQGGHIYLLSGLLRCGECNNTMTGRYSTNWGTKRREYTDRKNTAGFREKGCGHTVACEVIDNEVWDKILNALNDPEQVASAKEEETVSYEESEVERVENQLEKIKIGRKRLLKLFADGSKDIGEAELREAMRETKAEEETLSAKLLELQAKSIERNSHEYSQQLLQEGAEFLLSKDVLTVEDKQRLIRHIVKEVRVTKEEIIIYSF